MVGVDFFTPLMYPLFANFPVIETLPIFIADFDQPGVVSPFGGCPTAFPSSAQMIAEIKEHDRLAVIWDQNAPGDRVLADTQERFYQYYADTMEDFEFQGFPTTPGETAGQPAVVQQVSDYLDGAENPAVYFGISAAECAAVHHGPGRAPASRPRSTSPTPAPSDAVKGLPESDGVIFELQGYLLDQPELNSDFVNAELAAREAAIDEFGPQTPLTSYTRQAFSGVVFIYQVANQMLGRRRRHRRPRGAPRGVHGRRQLPRRRYRPISLRRQPERVRVGVRPHGHLRRMGRQHVHDRRGHPGRGDRRQGADGGRRAGVPARRVIAVAGRVGRTPAHTTSPLRESRTL